MKQVICLLCVISIGYFFVREKPNDAPLFKAYDKIVFSLNRPTPENIESDKYFFSGLCLADITMFSWDTPEAIPQSQLLAFYCVVKGTEMGSAIPHITVPAKKVERELKKYFAISKEYLRKSEYYDKDINSYTFDIKPRKALEVAITDINKKDGITRLTYEYREKDNKVLMYGDLSYRVNVGNVEYISCNAESTFLNYPPEDGCIRFVYHVTGFDKPMWAEVKESTIDPQYTEEQIDEIAEKIFVFIMSGKLKTLADATFVNADDYEYYYEIDKVDEIV